MPLAVRVSRPRMYDRPMLHRWTPTRAPLTFSVTGDVTAVLTVEGVAPTSLAGGSAGAAFVRPAQRAAVKVGVA